jgi:hypothetical protein
MEVTISALKFFQNMVFIPVRFSMLWGKVLATVNRGISGGHIELGDAPKIKY